MTMNDVLVLLFSQSDVDRYSSLPSKFKLFSRFLSSGFEEFFQQKWASVVKARFMRFVKKYLTSLFWYVKMR